MSAEIKSESLVLKLSLVLYTPVSVRRIDLLLHLNYYYFPRPGFYRNTW